jgi:hypothetical protein
MILAHGAKIVWQATFDIPLIFEEDTAILLPADKR